MGSAAAAKEVLFYREGDSGVWRRTGHASIRRRWRRFRGAKAVGEGGLAGVKDRVGGMQGGGGASPPSREWVSTPRPDWQAYLLPGQLRDPAGGRWFLPAAREARRRDKICELTGGGADLFCSGTERRSGIRPSMATIMERALTWPVMLPRVISGLRLAISQRRARTCSRPRFSRR